MVKEWIEYLKTPYEIDDLRHLDIAIAPAPEIFKKRSAQWMMQSKNQLILCCMFISFGCSPKLKSVLAPGEADNGRQSCNANSTRENAFKKIEDRDFDPHQKNITDKVLAKGSKFAAVFKKNCKDRGFFAGLVQLRNAPSRQGTSTYEDQIVILPEELSYENFKNLVQADPCLVAISPLRKLELQSAPNDARYAEMNHLKTIAHDQVWSKLNSPLGITHPVVVAVIDSGAMMNQPDLEGQWWSNSLENNGVTGIDDDQNGYIDDINGFNFFSRSSSPQNPLSAPHAEHVSGIIAAINNNNIGVAGVGGNQMRIMNLMVMCGAAPVSCNSNGNPGDPITWMNEAIRYAADNGAHVINLSLGENGFNQTSRQAVEYAVSKGSFVAAAAGNNAAEITPINCFSPACYGSEIEGFMSVGAFDGAPAGGRARCSFSNFSTSQVEISAPGCDTSKGNIGSGAFGVLSTGKADDYIHMPGTSMASPHLAAAAAVVIGYLRDRTGTQPSPQVVEDILSKAALPVTVLNAYVLGGRSLDMKILVDYLDSHYVNAPTSTTTTLTIPSPPTCP